MEHLFLQAANFLFQSLKQGEDLVLNWRGEKSLFIRFNASKVRQVSDVLQVELSITLKSNGRQSSIQIPVSGNEKNDKFRMSDSLKVLRSRVQSLEKLDFFIPVINLGGSRSIYEADLPECHDYIDIICKEAADVDLVGVLISGYCYRGHTNSHGQQHWFESSSFNLDYSLYSGKEKAVKSTYSGTVFSRAGFIASLNAAKENLHHMKTSNKTIKPGKYRCYLAPAAVADILKTLSFWQGLSQSQLQRGNSPLLPLQRGEAAFSRHFHLKEDFSLGLHPRFNDNGETSSMSLDIFRHGQIANLLTCTKTAKEFNLQSNYANNDEILRSPILETGNLPKEHILDELQTGLYLSNLHYLNWSDLNKGRLTGMTRFACFYIEKGKIIAPIRDVRFDETLYNMWGANLLAITDFAETLLNTDTFFRRNVGGCRCPGLLIKDFNFTL